MRKIVFILLLTYAPVALTFENLQKGIGISEEVDSQLRNVSIPYAIARQGQRSADDNELVAAFLETDEAVYSLSTKPELVFTKKLDRSLLGHWPLTPWPSYTRFQEETKRLSDSGLDHSGFGFGAKRPVGCLDSTPLRYGDVFSDGAPELALFLSNDFVLFSPQYNRIVFATGLSINDWMTLKDTEYIYTDEGGNVSKPTTAPQYDSWYANTFRMLGGVAGYRGYSKIYIDDLDEDDHQDIIVWKKLYVSKLENDPLRGFTFVRNQFEHYEADLVAQAQLPAGVTGEYLLQTTDQTTIQDWLTSKNLTWQKGYPSQSECSGQEKQLIPEMHDPLLNDADVLK